MPIDQTPIAEYQDHYPSRFGHGAIEARAPSPHKPNGGSAVNARGTKLGNGLWETVDLAGNHEIIAD
jgi:hypothetical protein